LSIFTAQSYASKVYAVVMCLSLSCLSVFFVGDYAIMRHTSHQRRYSTLVLAWVTIFG